MTASCVCVGDIVRAKGRTCYAWSCSCIVQRIAEGVVEGTHAGAICCFMMERDLNQPSTREPKMPALVFVSGEAPAVAKLLCNYAKEHAALSLIAGCVDAQVFDKAGVEQFATIPSIEVLRAQICGTIKAPISGLATVLHASMARVVRVLSEIQKQQQG